MRIKAFSTDKKMSNSLLCIMDWYGVDSLERIPETAALDFLAKLESGEIRIPREV
jgi:hypothetical protein